ncbi:AGC kinase [Besnoitia besnoiti]|uniref:AGC kinase n=1 Tax=Besnoitia besnoiti TaxID=94643 RepID=A0A2A9MFL0_BESBE|nr:AGC kinase [Besnoitia besnoiti]PFH34443.1 AGC kinase [Besnoitia besnoiti]
MKAGFLGAASSRQSKLSVAKAAPPFQEDGKFTFDHFSLERFLGRGNFCEVFEASLVGDKEGKTYALKVFDRKQVMKLNKVQDVIMERHCMLRLGDPGHPNVVKMVATFKDEFRVCIVYELAENGELWDLMKHGGVHTGSLAARYILQLCSAVEYIHSKGIIHRDIKAENVVVSRDGNLKLIDFGTAVDLEHPEVHPAVLGSASPLGAADGARARPARMRFAHHVGTAQFMPPEAIQNKDSGKMRDLWSLGCTIYQILTGNPPFQATTNYFVFLKVQARDLHFPPHFPPGARDLVEQLLRPEQAQRLGAKGGIAEVLAHPYILSLKARFSSSLARSLAPVPSLQDLCFRAILNNFFVRLMKLQESQEASHEREREATMRRASLASVDEEDEEEEKGECNEKREDSEKREDAHESGEREGAGTKEAPTESDTSERPTEAVYDALISEVLSAEKRKEAEQSQDAFVRMLMDRLRDAAKTNADTQQWQEELAAKWMRENERREQQEAQEDGDQSEH